jgi:hypothetical protein
MAQKKQYKSLYPKSAVPKELKDIDVGWDDDPGELSLDLQDDDAFDRVTAIPDEPTDEYARRMMANAGEAPPISTRTTDSGVPPTPVVSEAPGALTLDLDEEDHGGQHDEPTRRMDPSPETLERSIPDVEEESFEAHRPPSEVPPTLTSSSVPAGRRATSRDSLPPALGFRTPQAPKSPPPGEFQAAQPPKEATEPPAREPSVPRTRLPTAELVLELDHQHTPGSALELAENAPSVETPQSRSLEFEVPQVQAIAASGSASAHADMKDRYAMGDFTGALVIAEGILDADPDDPDATLCAQRCRDVLTQMYAARLGPLDQTVAVAIPAEEIRWLSLDHRAGFLLSLVDGSLTIEEILDISGMSRLDALRIMFNLLDQRVVSLGA